MSKYFLPLFSLILLLQGCEGEEPITLPPNELSVFAQNLVNTHNRWRAEVGVEDLEWDEELAEKAAELLDIDACRIRDNADDLGQTGLYAAMGVTGKDVVNTWASFGPAYNYAADSCELSPGACDPYKQIVWANSKKVGCANQLCFDGTSNMWVCLYDPKGNIEGERPY